MSSKYRGWTLLRTQKNTYAYGWGWQKPVPHPPENVDFFWAPDFFLENQEAYFPVSPLKFGNIEEAIEDLFEPFSTFGFQFQDLNWAPASAKDYQQIFDSLMSEIESASLQKAVPVVIQKAPLSGKENQMNWPALLRHLDQLPESLKVFVFCDGEDWMLGATPETLIAYDGETLETEALAGTSKDLTYSLLSDPKERDEHQLVVKDLVQKLSMIGEPQVGTTDEKTLPTLKHLRTPLKVRVLDPKSFQLSEFSGKLHPTPALGGSPAKEAFEWLHRQKNSTQRMRYGAPFGFVTKEGFGHIVVAIRALQKNKDHWLSVAGAGVVRASVCEKEWAEIQSKQNSVLKIFEDFS